MEFDGDSIIISWGDKLPPLIKFVNFLQESYLFPIEWNRLLYLSYNQTIIQSLLANFASCRFSLFFIESIVKSSLKFRDSPPETWWITKWYYNLNIFGTIIFDVMLRETAWQFLSPNCSNFRRFRWNIAFTRVAIYISCLILRNQIPTIEMDFIVFQKYSPWWSVYFCMRLKQFSKHFFNFDCGNSKKCALNGSTVSSRAENRWWRHFIWMCGHKKVSGCPIWAVVRMAHQSMFWPIKNSFVWVLSLSWWSLIRLLFSFLRISAMTCIKQMVMEYSELAALPCHSHYMTGNFWTTFTELVLERTSTLEFDILLHYSAIGWCFFAVWILQVTLDTTKCSRLAK